jgi:inner membrane protein
MLVFAHLGLTLAAAQLFKRRNPDLAMVALGSLLPDMIDKPLGYLIFGSPGNGRIIAHTLLFLLCLVALAALSPSHRLYSLSGGVSSHLILDSMWLSPAVLFWPLLGSFPLRPPVDIASYLATLIQGLHKPGLMVPEVLGLGYLAYFCWSRRPALAT